HLSTSPPALSLHDALPICGTTLPNGVRYAEPDVGEATGFVRGDPNASGSADLSDAVFILGYLFLGRPTTIDCMDSADSDGNGRLDRKSTRLNSSHVKISYA